MNVRVDAGTLRHLRQWCQQEFPNEDDSEYVYDSMKDFLESSGDPDQLSYDLSLGWWKVYERAGLKGMVEGPDPDDEDEDEDDDEEEEEEWEEGDEGEDEGEEGNPPRAWNAPHEWDADLDPILAPFEEQYGRVNERLRKKLLAIQERETAKARASGFELLALQALAGSPLQKLFQQLRDNK